MEFAIAFHDYQPKVRFERLYPNANAEDITLKIFPEQYFKDAITIFLPNKDAALAFMNEVIDAYENLLKKEDSNA